MMALVIIATSYSDVFLLKLVIVKLAFHNSEGWIMGWELC